MPRPLLWLPRSRNLLRKHGVLWWKPLLVPVPHRGLLCACLCLSLLPVNSLYSTEPREVHVPEKKQRI